MPDRLLTFRAGRLRRGVGRALRSAGRRAGRAIIAAALLVPAVVDPPTVADAPRPTLIWTAAAPVRAASEISVVPDTQGDGCSEILVAGWGPREAHDVLLLDGRSGVELWRRRFEDGPVAPARWVDLLRGPSVLAAHGDVMSVIHSATGELVDEVKLAGPIGQIVVGRLDGDAAGDVVYSAGVERNDVLVALSGADLSELWTFTAEPDQSRFGDGFSGLALLDIDADGLDEGFACENMRSVLALSARGELLWKTELAERTKYVPRGAVSGGPLIADFLGGGVRQLAVGLWAGGLVLIDPVDGDVLWRDLFGADAHRRHAGDRRLPRFLKTLLLETGEPVNDLLAVELDGMSGPEIVFGCSDGSIYAVSPRSGRVLWSLDAQGQVFDRPVAIDATGDGTPDVVAWDEEGVYLIDGRDGERLEGFPPASDLSGAVIADLDGDGGVELIELARNGTIRAFGTGLPCSRAPRAPGCVR